MGIDLAEAGRQLSEQRIPCRESAAQTGSRCSAHPLPGDPKKERVPGKLTRKIFRDRVSNKISTLGGAGHRLPQNNQKYGASGGLRPLLRRAGDGRQRGLADRDAQGISRHLQ
jgi:hypothetical protein